MKHLAIRVIAFGFLLFVAPAAASAQGIIGSDMPKEIFGRADSDAEIAALNAEIDQRRVIALSTVVSSLGVVCVVAYRWRKKKTKKTGTQ